MPPRDRANALNDAPLEDLLTILLKQFKGLLAAKGIALSDGDIGKIAREVAGQAAQDERIAAMREALAALVEESKGVLASWNLSFEQALATGMDAMPGWETTADFLEIAEEKANAELRIAAGAALVTALGDLRYRSYLLHLAAGDYDVDTIFARRVLAFASRIDADEKDWLSKIRAWLDEKTS